MLAAWLVLVMMRTICEVINDHCHRASPPLATLLGIIIKQSGQRLMIDTEHTESSKEWPGRNNPSEWGRSASG